jgi:RHS repeat-associated protein
MRRHRARERSDLTRHLRSLLEALVIAGIIAGCGDGGMHGVDGGGAGAVDARPGEVPDAPTSLEPGTPPRNPPASPSHEGACEDDLDDDADGYIDCMDEDCAAEPACALAPPLDRTVARGFHDSVRFLYEGPQAVQVGANPTAFDTMRVSVLRGRVLDRDGMAVEGVRVAVHGHDVYGYTETREGGMFDLVVNGGGPLTVSYQAAGFLPVQRTIETGYHDYHWVPDVVLTPRDTAVTEIVPGAAEPQAARGSLQEDEDGARQATLVFPAGTQAVAVLPDGSEISLDSMHIRATEYTVGERGPEAMPGTLPATSAYTYAVELSVDEADALGASSVVFDRPVGFYLENFLEFPVGTTVPLGYYDRELARWVPAESGVVLAIVDIAEGMAALDLDGDGLAEDDAALAAAGITAEERVELAALYMPGQTLWRAPITHFTPWDCNWPFGPPDGAIFPDDDFLDDPDRDAPCTRGGSVIQCETQSLGQFVDVPGTHITLAYHGHRTRGWEADRALGLQLSGTNLPPIVKGIVVEAEIAGQRLGKEFAPSSGLRTSMSWDGRDAYGRITQGVQRARVRLGYVYDGAYGTARRFAGQALGRISGSTARQQVTLWREAVAFVGTWDATPQGLGGFGIAEHHAYDRESGTLFLGDGTRRSARNVAPVASLVGTLPVSHGDAVHAVHVAADGSVYTASLYGLVHRIAPDGTITLVAWGLSEPRDLAVTADGTIYVAETRGNRVRAIAPDGTKRIVAGGGTDPFLVPGGATRPATEVALREPTGLALAADGGLYIADRGNSAVRYVDASGMLATLEGVGEPFDVVLGSDGSLYVSQLIEHAVRRVHPDGRVEIVFGREAGIAPVGLAVRNDGAVLVADIPGRRVMRIDSDGTRTAAAGGGDRTIAHGEIATDVAIPSMHRIDLDAEDRLLFSDGRRIFRVLPALPGLSSDEIAVPSRGGSELYVFDRQGRHRETRDALTGVTLLAFSYDAHGRIITVTDRDGLATHIERDARGLARAIIGPYQQRTELGYDEHDHLATLRDPLQREIHFDYDAAGRLTTMLDARGNEHHYTYDARGRLLTDTGPTGYTQTLSPVDEVSNGRNVAVTTSLQRTIRYQSQRVSTGERLRITQLPWGGLGMVRKRAGRTETTAPDGTSTEIALASDPRWHSQAPWAREARVRTPQGRTLSATSAREVSFDDPAHPHRISSLVQRYTLGNRTSTARYDGASQTITSQSPTGRQRTVTLDALGRVQRIEQPGSAPYLVTYDDDGRIESVQRGEGASARTMLFHYDVHGNLAEVIDPLQRAHHYEHDIIGRMRAQTRPDGTRITFDYDAHDNLVSLTPPSRPAHQFRYTGADLAEQYIPPAVPGVDAEARFHYNADLAPAVAEGPSDQQLAFHHDHAGRIESLTLARGDYAHEYDPATGHLAQLTSPDAVGLHFGRDGPLLRDTRWTTPGAADVVVAYDHDDAFRLSKLTIQGEPPIEHGYDADDYLIQAGPLNILRDPQTGLPDITRAGAIETDLDVSQFAEPERFTATFAGQPLYQATYTRDALGRITGIEELIAGQPRSILYDYDAADRLATVHESGQPTRDYLYDPNGNLVEIRESGIPVLTATHDAQDRLLTHGRFALTHADSGHLASKLDTFTGESTAYHYDELGNLLGADLADGRSIQYLVDGADRRVAKLVDGELQWLFVYAGGLPLARLFPDGAVESIYVYGALAHVPDLVIKSGRTYRIIHDHLGSPRLVVDTETGDIAQRLDYDVHGRVLIDTNLDFQPFSFAGGLHDVDTGLVRFGARDYDPALARWTAKDPSGFAGGDTNLYAYAYGDSVNFVDPNGEFAFLVPLVIAAAKGALAGAAISGGIALGAQLIGNGGSIDCVDWGGVGANMVDGGLWGAAGGALLQGLGRAFSALRSVRAGAAQGTAGLTERAREIHGALDPIAQSQRTTAVLRTKSGTDIVAAGGRDLTPAQRALLRPGEAAAKLPGAHAEATALNHAQQSGLMPAAIATTRNICPQCATAIEVSGGSLTSPTTAIWP